jgi:prepilin-type N-terminal cleavage/methylation domain-containing protein
MFTLKLPNLRKPGIIRNERGFTLVEAVISIALIGIISAGLFSGLSSAATVLLHNDAYETAKNLTEAQMEYVKGLDFIAGAGPYVYTPNISLNVTGYSVVIDAEPVSVTPTGQTARDGFIQQIKVTVTGPKNMTYSLTDYKVK